MRDESEGMHRGEGKIPVATAYCPEGVAEGKQSLVGVVERASRRDECR